MRETIRLFVLISAMAVWLGGLTFYAAIVVPAANQIIGNGEQGFVTQEVTNWLNKIGVVVLVLLMANAVCLGSRLFWLDWLVLVSTQIALFVIHSQIDGVLDLNGFEVLDNSRFRLLHEWYLIVVTIQWLAGRVAQVQHRVRHLMAKAAVAVLEAVDEAKAEE